ncbi:hypothetical protein QQ045_002767 [Rhodiola kirilowii]
MATTRTGDERAMAHEHEKAKEAQAEMELHDDKAQHAGHKQDSKLTHSLNSLHTHGVAGGISQNPARVLCLCCSELRYLDCFMFIGSLLCMPEYYLSRTAPPFTALGISGRPVTDLEDIRMCFVCSGEGEDIRSVGFRVFKFEISSWSYEGAAGLKWPIDARSDFCVTWRRRRQTGAGEVPPQQLIQVVEAAALVPMFSALCYAGDYEAAWEFRQ